MFKFTINKADFLNEFLSLYTEYVNKSYKYTMKYLVNPLLTEYKENERLVMIVINKSVYQNLYSFLKLNDSNLQFSAFSCLESAVNSMRLYRVLSSNPKYLHDYITNPEFSVDYCESEMLDNQKEYNAKLDDFSLREFYNGLHKVNSFQYKNSSIAPQITDNNIFLGLSCGNTLSDELQNEVRKNLVGAYLSLQMHLKMFFNGGVDKELEDFEDMIYSKFLEYIKLFSNS